MKLKLKQDKYRKSRGGHARFLAISCAKCKSQVAIYQKDGPGILKRMYVDRIIELNNLMMGSKLICKKCKEVLGVSIIYKKENRPAFRLFEGAVTKKIISA